MVVVNLSSAVERQQANSLIELTDTQLAQIR